MAPEPWTFFAKFAANYNITALRMLANHKPALAPALQSCARVIGGTFMVAMEYLPGTSLLDVLVPLPASVRRHRVPFGGSNTLLKSYNVVGCRV